MNRNNEKLMLKQNMLLPVDWRFIKSCACAKGLFVFPVLTNI